MIVGVGSEGGPRAGGELGEGYWDGERGIGMGKGLDLWQRVEGIKGKDMIEVVGWQMRSQGRWGGRE